MAETVCLAANTLYYPQGAGHFWVFLNWALGLKYLGCKVYWLEKFGLNDCKSPARIIDLISQLKQKLASFGFSDNLVLFSTDEIEIPRDVQRHYINVFDAAVNTDLLLDVRYDLPENIVNAFSRSAMLDIDPGLLQFLLDNGSMRLAPHDLYFSIGETVGKPTALFPNAGINWNYTPPCVATDYWQPTVTSTSAVYTTISHWNDNKYVIEKDGSFYSNDKRDGFLPYLDLPGLTGEPFELALCLQDPHEQAFLQGKGWSIKEAWSVSDTPEAYKNYIQQSKGEFSCVKPHCIKMQNAWISDRTLCYLASGKPAIMQNTGPSAFLPHDAGLLRFQDLNSAIKCIEQVKLNYENHSMLARALAIEYFDAKKVTKSLLERSL